MVAFHTKKTIALLGYFFTYGFLILTIITFIVAYVNPYKKVIVTINSFGEQYLDIGCFVFAFIISTYGLYFMIKDYKKNN